MNVSKLCSLGYFDRVLVDGYAMSMFNTRGIEIKSNETFVDAINTNIQSYTQGVGKIRVTIYGESTFNLDDDNLLGMRLHREQNLKLVRTKVGNNDRYAIAYVDILILKSDFSFPDKVLSKGKSPDDIAKLAKGEDEYMLLKKALDMQRSMKTDDTDKPDCNIAIADRVYVNRNFRRCGISKWIHSNIADIIKTYGMVDVSAVLLIPGDFSNEAEQVFGVSSDKYKSMLIEHYKDEGYKFIDKYIMCKYFYKRKHIINLRRAQRNA